VLSNIYYTPAFCNQMVFTHQMVQKELTRLHIDEHLGVVRINQYYYIGYISLGTEVSISSRAIKGFFCFQNLPTNYELSSLYECTKHVYD